jgi:DNA-binding transcriptional regulator YdaS (Cro superfamily)
MISCTEYKAGEPFSETAFKLGLTSPVLSQYSSRRRLAPTMCATSTTVKEVILPAFTFVFLFGI